jgi:tetratricopeptide (TPR) repeat protein
LAHEADVLAFAGPLVLALLALRSLWRRIGAPAGSHRDVAARLAHVRKTLVEELRACLDEPSVPFTDAGAAGPLLGARDGFERDISAAVGMVAMEAGGSRAKAKQILRERLEQATAAGGPTRPDGWRELGALALIDDEEAARKAYAKAADLESGCAETHMLLGVLCLRTGKLDAAEAAFRRQMQLTTAEGGADYRALAMLGDVYAARRAFKEALELYRKACAEVQDRFAREPGSVELCRHLSITADRVADMQTALGDLDAALEHYQLAREAAELVIARDPANPEHQRDLSISHEHVGEILKAKGDLEGALVSFRQGLAVAESLSNAHPQSVQWRWDLSASHDRLGDVFAALGKAEEALKSYRQGLEMAEEIVAHCPANLQWLRDLAASYHKAGAIEAERHNTGEARALLERGRAIIARLERIAAYSSQWRSDLECFDRTLRTLGP